jgi:hypothetical protein
MWADYSNHTMEIVLCSADGALCRVRAVHYDLEANCNTCSCHVYEQKTVLNGALCSDIHGKNSKIILNI